MTASLEVTRNPIGVEVRRGTYEVVVDDAPVGSVELHETFKMPVEPGHHTLQIRNGRNLSGIQSFDAADEVIALRSSGKRLLPIFLISFLVPSLALSLRRVGR